MRRSAWAPPCSKNCAVRGIETEAGAVSGVVTEQGAYPLPPGGAGRRRLDPASSAAISASRFPQLMILGSVMRTAPFAGPKPAAGASNFAFRKRLDGGYTVAQRNANDRRHRAG